MTNDPAKRLRPFITVCLALAAGCSSFDKDWKAKLPWSQEARLKASKFQTPDRMIAIWTPDVLSQTGKPPTRGFGGRLYFYNTENQPVPVEGQLVVYAFDDDHNTDRPNEPDRKFAFTPDQFTQHYSESDLGASYSVWIPWDAVGGEPRKLSLIPVFTASAGKVVIGSQTANLLPGRSANPESPPTLMSQQKRSATHPVHAAAHETHPGLRAVSQATQNQLPPNAVRMKSTTIHLTPGLQRRLEEAGDQVLDPSQTNSATTPMLNLPTLPSAATERATATAPLTSRGASAGRSATSPHAIEPVPLLARFGRSAPLAPAAPTAPPSLPAAPSPLSPATPPSSHSVVPGYQTTVPSPATW